MSITTNPDPYIEDLEQEIERLREREEQLEKNLQVLDYVEDRCAKLEAVVDAALKQDNPCDELIEAIAALESEYTIKIKGIPSKLEPPEDDDD